MTATPAQPALHTGCLKPFGKECLICARMLKPDGTPKPRYAEAWAYLTGARKPGAIAKVEGDGLPCCDDPFKELPPPFSSLSTDLLCAIVIGTYSPWPELAELQVRAIRYFAGPGTAILIADDCSPGQAELAATAAAHPDVFLQSNSERIGHTGGDISAVWKGLVWAKKRGVKYLAKLSQRFFWLTARWLQDNAIILQQSGRPLLARQCAGRENFPLRTESMIFDVDRWATDELIAELTPRRWGREHTAESVLYRMLAVHLGGQYEPWEALLPDRYTRAPGQLWHCSAQAQDYRALAVEFGVTLNPSFHCRGWQDDAKNGTHVWG